MVDFPQIIRDELIRQNKSTAWLASQVGVPDEMTVHRFLNGHIELSSCSIQSILSALDMTVAALKSKAA